MVAADRREDLPNPRIADGTHQTRRGDTLVTQFRVNDKLVTARCAWDGDKLHVEMTLAGMKAPRKSKLTTGKTEVESYRVESTQSATLTRSAK